MSSQIWVKNSESRTAGGQDPFRRNEVHPVETTFSKPCGTENPTEVGRWPTQQKKELNLSVFYFIYV
jgi:hypothetical protein